LRPEILRVDDRALVVDKGDRHLAGVLRQVQLARIGAVAQRGGDVGIDQHRPADPARRVGQPARLKRRGDCRQALVHLGNAGDLAELRHLRDHLRIVDGIERILRRQLCGHQLQEVVLIHRPAGLASVWTLGELARTLLIVVIGRASKCRG
jgi:hypothetical protein